MKKENAQELEEKILKHKRLYYQGRPEISDFEYDALEDKLRELNPNSFALELIGSDTFNTDKVAHESKMLSLNKSYNLEELLKWMGDEEVVSTLKIDGSSCSLIYNNGVLEIAKTRGDGRFGENITEKVLYIDSIPKKIKEKSKIEVRGEIYCCEKNFIALAQEMEKRELATPNSQRNIVAGIIGRRENIDLAKYLTFQAFELIASELPFETEIQKFDYLSHNNFDTPEIVLHKDDKKIETTLSEAQVFMSEGDYLIDGLVFTYNLLSHHEVLGATAHHPRYKMAFKFQGVAKPTKIKSISWQVSRNGFLTPVANVEPVDLSGASVSRVTLHNYGMVSQFKLKKGDTIEIVRSGEVIPKFIAVIERGEGKFSVPTNCPSCGETVSVEEIRLVCHNPECPDKVKDEILNFIKKIGIEDLSSKRLEEFIRLKLVRDIPSLYELTVEDLLGVDKVKDKLANKIIASIKKSLEADLVNFLASLGLSGGAYNKCEKVVLSGYDTIDKILKLKVQDLQEIDSFAETSAHSLVDSINAKRVMIEKLRSYGFKLESNIASPVEGEVSGMKFCITGTLSMKRSELEKLVKAHGGLVQNGVSKDTSYLLTNDTESSSSKFKKALALSTPIINEDQFFKLIGK